jgi:flavin-dependent dehydrogenase
MKSANINDNSAVFPNGGSVVIIGGGPGGTACALALKKFAELKAIEINITVIEGKEFTNRRHHNQCVGVLSPPLPNLLEESLGVPFPRDICIGEIHQYILHSTGEEITLNEDGEPSNAVRRNQFDAYMLEQVTARNIPILRARAVDLEFHTDYAIVYTENRSLEADVIVGAFGLDEGSAAMFTRLTPYRPPLSLESVVTNYPSNDYYLEELSGKIHAFLPSNPRIEFGAITPKCDHLTINIAGPTVDAPLMRTFLEIPEVNEILPPKNSIGDSTTNNMFYYKGRFPRSSAHGFYGDRYVMVGDAAGLVRTFKGKGTTTAILTGIRAADTIINHGISRQAFHQYYRNANQDIIQDLPYGRGMRLATMLVSKMGLMGMVLRAARKTPLLQSALFGAVSGNTPYKEILGKVLHPDVIWAILRAIKKDTQ